jgi:hypothetical protein
MMRRAGGVPQVVKHLPGKCEALSSNPSTAKKHKKEKRIAEEMAVAMTLI